MNLQGRVTFLGKYKLNSEVLIKNISDKFVVGVISNDTEEIKKENQFTQTIIYRLSPIFQDPRSTNLGTRVVSNLEKLYLTIKNYP